MRATRRYGLIMGALACCFLLPLAACGSGPPGSSREPAGFSAAELAAAVASAGPAAAGPAVQATPEPTRPTAAHDATSAEATLRYFWEAYTYAYRTFDTGPLESVSEGSCSVCTGVRDDVGMIAAADTRVRGYRVTVSHASATGDAGGARIQVVATISRQPGQAVDAKGLSTDLPGFGARRCTATLDWNGTAWVISKIVTTEA